MTQPTPIPEAMIKAAQEADRLHIVDVFPVGDDAWRCDCGASGDDQPIGGVAADEHHRWNAVFAAALATCEVHEQFGWVRGEPDTEDYRAAWHGDRAKAESEAHYWKGRFSPQRDFRLARRLKIVTPAEAFPAGESA